LLVVVGTVLVAVPVNAVIDPLPVLGNTSGPAGSTQTVTAPVAPVATAFPAGHDVLVLFDKEVADADLGKPLIAFGANDRYVPGAAPGFPAGQYVPGEPIYSDLPLPDPGATFISPGDTRLTPVTVPAGAWGPTTTYAAGSVVQAGAFDIAWQAAIAQPLMTATAHTTMHTVVACNDFPSPGPACPATLNLAFNWGRGDGIYIRDATNIVAGFARVGPGDIRARHPSVTITLDSISFSESYNAWTKVKSPVLDFQKPIYNHAGGPPNVVTATDTRLRNVVIPQIRYPAGSFVLTGQQELVVAPAVAVVAFSNVAPFDAFADANNNGRWDPGEWSYRIPAGPFPGLVNNLAVRNSYVTTAGQTYAPSSVASCVAPNLDSDCNTPIRLFPATQFFYDAEAVPNGYEFGEWIYNTPAAGALVPCPGGLATCIAGVHSQRASDVDWTDKGMAATGTLSTLLQGAWNPANEWSNVVGYAAPSLVAWGDSDVGRTLTAFAAQDRHVGAAPYASGQAIYRDNDNDNLVSVGDTRQVLVSRTALAFAARTWPGPWPWTLLSPAGVYQAYWYTPGSSVIATDPDPAGAPLNNFAVTEFYYDQFDDGSYLGSDLVAHAGTNTAGNAQPFPIAALGAAAQITFTVPTNAPIGNHVVFIMDDMPPPVVLGGNFAGAGFLAGAAPVAGGTLAFESLPWFVGNVVDIGWTTGGVLNGFLNHAGPAFFVVNVPVRVFLRPGVRDEYKPGWSHTLDTLRGTQGGGAQGGQIIDRYQEYAILASMSDSIGDFQFDLQILAPISDIRIYVPSNFTFAYSSSGYGDATTSDKIYSVWTDITNDYSYVSVRVLGEDDPIAPGWHLVEIGRIPTPTLPTPSFTIVPGLYHIRLFQMRAPFTAGLYHFKIYVNGVSIGAGNFPIIIVKSSLNPAYITGLVALRGLAPAILVSGRVTASGTTSIGKYAEAVAYFGPQDLEASDAIASYYRYWLFGLPAGVFDLTASASGFLKVSSRLTVDEGQSLHSDFELERGTEVRVTVWSKNANGPIPWGNLWQVPYGTNNPNLAIDNGNHHRDILLRLLDQYDESVGYWASDDIDPPYGPPWTLLTIDGKRNYSRLLLKPSTLPSSGSYTETLTDSRGLPSVRLDGHVPADTADLIEGIDAGFYKLEMQVTGYVIAEADDWQRSLTIAPNSRTYSQQVDLRRSSWIMATAIISNAVYAPVSGPTLVIVARSTDNLEKAVAAGTFPAGATQFTMVLEGFDGMYNLHRASTDYQDYGLEPVDYTLDAYMADMATPFAGIAGVGWYLVEEDIVDARISFGATASAVAFHLDALSIEFVLRSMRLQQPMQLAPWTFPGAGIRIILIDELGNMTATLDPFFYGLVQDDGTIIGDPYDIGTGAIGWHGMLRVLFTGLDPGPVSALGGLYPTRMKEGLYHVSTGTLGYIQLRDTSVYLHAGIHNDLEVDLVQGAQIRVEVDFRHEGVATGFNGSVRVELYNQVDTLVGASIYSGAQPNPNLNYYLPFNALEDWKLVPGAAEGAGTGAQPQRAFYSRLYYGVPPITWANWPMMIRSDANRLSMPQGARVAFDVFGFHSYSGSSDSRIERLWANGWDTTNGIAHADSGIRGSRDVQGLEGWGNFTVRVWAFDPYGPNGVFDANGPDGIFGTEDDYTSPDLADGSLSDFRAYVQTTEITDVEASWGGAAVVRVTLEEQPSLLGVVSWIDMFGNLRTLPWAQVIERSPDDVWASSTTGSYRLWLSEGSHEFYVTTIGEEQLWQPFRFEIILAGPGVHAFSDVTLAPPSTATPEFKGPAWTAVIPLTALLILFSRRRNNRTHSS